jgi:hypothetical protein
VRHVVAVADVGELQPIEAAEALLQREQVGQRLARMVVGGQHVHDGHGRVLGQLGDRRVRARAHADRRDVA